LEVLVSLRRCWKVRTVGVAALAALSAAILLLSGSSVAWAATSCSLYASPSGSNSGDGSAGSPLRSPQALVDALSPGETGCLENGTYSLAGGSSGSQLKFNHGGSSDAPITLTSAPGETATLDGGPVYVPHGSDYVTISDVHVDTTGTDQVGVQIMGAYDSLTDSDVTNHNTHYSCIIIGSDTGYGQASHTLIAGDEIHQCGYNPGDPYEDHGVYVDNSVDATIQNNIIWGMPYGWGVQIYPHSVGTQVLHNVIDDNGQGVVFGGNSSWTSSGNTVAYNIISNSYNDYNIQYWWGGSAGSNNLAKDNCLYNGNAGNVESPTGFTASGNMNANPQYTDASHHDYTLQSASPCLSLVGYDTAALIERGQGATAARSGTSHHHGRHHRLTGHHRGGRHRRLASRSAGQAYGSAKNEVARAVSVILAALSDRPARAVSILLTA
jgi:hypothetical protein